MRVRFRPSWLLAAAIAQAILLAALAHGTPAPAIRPAEASAFEGQGEVRLLGLVAGVHALTDSTRVTLEAGGSALDAIVPGSLHLPVGSWVEAAGRVGRFGGSLALFVSGPEAIAAAHPPGVARPSWSDLAAHPEAWSGEAIQVRGTVQGGSLADSDGHHVALGAGPWPKTGAVEATASLRYDAACLCHRLDASAVALADAWTP